MQNKGIITYHSGITFTASSFVFINIIVHHAKPRNNDTIIVVCLLAVTAVTKIILKNIDTNKHIRKIIITHTK